MNKVILFLFVAFSSVSVFGQNTQIRISSTIANPSFGFQIQEPNVDIEGYEGNEVIIEMVPKVQEKTPEEATGLKHIPMPVRDRDKEANILNPQVKHDVKNAHVSITLPTCNCERLVIKVPRDPVLGIFYQVPGREGKLSVKNINNEVQIQGWPPVIELNHVSGFIIASGGTNILSSNKIILTDIQWTNRTVMFNGQPRPMYYVVGSSSASIYLSIPDDLKANVMYSPGSGQVFSDLNLIPQKSTEEQIAQYGKHFAKDPDLKTIVLNNGGINIDLHTYSGNIYLQKQ